MQNWWEEAEVIEPAATGPQPLFTTPGDPFKVADERRAQAAEARASQDQAFQAQQIAYQQNRDRIADERYAREQEEERIKEARGKPMRQGDATKLDEEVSAYAYLKNSLGDFDDNYAGNTITGGLENTLQRKLGTGTPGQAEWWANFRTADNQIRNALFGASLTEGEKAAYNATTVSPDMDPGQVRANLARRAEIARKGLERRMGRLRAAGFSPQEIDAAAGEYLPDFMPKAASPVDENDEVAVSPALGRKGASSRLPDTPAGGPGLSLATGANYATPTDRKYQRTLQAAFEAGAGIGKLQGIAKQYGYPPLLTAQLVNAISYRDGTGRYKSQGPRKGAMVAVPNSGQRTKAAEVLSSVAASPVGAYFTNTADALSAGYLDEGVGALRSITTGQNMDELIAEADLGKTLVTEANPGASLGGQVTGGLLATLTGAGAAGRIAPQAIGALTSTPGRARAAMVAGDAGYGALYGSGQNNEDRGTGALVGGGAGIAGGMFGRGLTRGIGRLTRGVTNPAVRAMAEEGPLTLGQMAGTGTPLRRIIKGAEDALDSVPIVGGFVRQRRQDSVEGFDRGRFREALEPIGAQASGEIGEEGIANAQGAVADAYTTALGPVRLQSDPQFEADLTRVAGAAGALPEPLRDTFNASVMNRVRPFFTQTGGMGGRELQAAVKGLRMDRRSELARSTPMADVMGDRMTDVEEALFELAERQAPGTRDALSAANSANRRVSILEDAVIAGTNQGGRFTPAQLGRAAANNTKRFSGKRAAARGDVPFAEAQRAAQDILPSQLPNSGTADRLIAAALLPAAAGGTGYLLGPEEAAAAALLTAPYTRAGQRLLTSGLVRRSDRARRIGASIVNRGGMGGMFGSTLAVPMVVSE